MPSVFTASVEIQVRRAPVCAAAAPARNTALLGMPRLCAKAWRRASAKAASSTAARDVGVR